MCLEVDLISLALGIGGILKWHLFNTGVFCVKSSIFIGERALESFVHCTWETNRRENWGVRSSHPLPVCFPDWGVLVLSASPREADVLDSTLIILVVFLFDISVLSFLSCGDLKCTQYQYCDKTKVLSCRKIFHLVSITFLMIPNFYCILAAVIWWALSFWLRLR